MPPQETSSRSPVFSPYTSTSATSSMTFRIFWARVFTIFSWFIPSYETMPESESFSRPPTRCSRPGVPGMAQGRMSFASRRYGM